MVLKLTASSEKPGVECYENAPAEGRRRDHLTTANRSSRLRQSRVDNYWGEL
jgi:hypothetical protein